MSNGYVPITITNNQSTATGTNFQQMLNINMNNYSSYLNSDLSNVYFSSDTAGANVIDSWLESGNSNTSTSTIFWVLLSNGIGANSSITIYMQIDLSGASHFNNTTTGEAPQLSGTYAEYDNGTTVFIFYDNFSGTSLDTSLWQVGSSGGSYSVNNGLTLTGAPSGSCEGLYSIPTFSAQAYTTDYYAYYASLTAGGEQTLGMREGTTGNNFVYIQNQASPAGYYIASRNSSGQAFTEIGAGSTSTYQVLTSWQSASPLESVGQINYGTQATNSTYSTAMTGGDVLQMFACDAVVNIYVQWARARLTPPNNTMPSISEGSIAINIANAPPIITSHVNFVKYFPIPFESVI